MVLKLQFKLFAISSTVRLSFWETNNKISILRWLATPLKCRSICFAVFKFFAIPYFTTTFRHSQECRNVVCGCMQRLDFINSMPPVFTLPETQICARQKNDNRTDVMYQNPRLPRHPEAVCREIINQKIDIPNFNNCVCQKLQNNPKENE